MRGGGRPGAGAGPALALTGRAPAAPFSSACPTPRSATWPWRCWTARCSRSCRGFWRSSTSPRRACTTSDCGCRTNTEVRGSGGTFPGRPWTQEPRVDGQGVQSCADPFSLLPKNFLLWFPRVPHSLVGRMSLLVGPLTAPRYRLANPLFQGLPVSVSGLISLG